MCSHILLTVRASIWLRAFSGDIINLFVSMYRPTAKFITARQKEIALERVRRTNGGRKDHDIKWNQVWEALMDLNVWGLFILSVCAYFPNGVLTTVSSMTHGRKVTLTEISCSFLVYSSAVLSLRIWALLPLRTWLFKFRKASSESSPMVSQVSSDFTFRTRTVANFTLERTVVPGYFAMRYAGLRFHIYTVAVFLAFAGSLALLLAPRVPGLLGALYGLHMFGAASGQVHGLTASNVGGYT